MLGPQTEIATGCGAPFGSGAPLCVLRVVAVRGRMSLVGTEQCLACDSVAGPIGEDAVNILPTGSPLHGRFLLEANTNKGAR